MVNNKSKFLVVSIKSTKLDPQEQELLTHKNIGGVILFTRNFANKLQLIDLVSQIKTFNSNAIVMVDHEGGEIWRFRDDHFCNPGPMQQLGEIFDVSPEKALDQAYDFGYKIAGDLLDCGIDLNLAPVIDLGIKKANGDYVSAIIGYLGRAIHDKPEVVAMVAAKFIEGQKARGMKAVGKHFPGHGSISTDTHLNITVDSRSKEEIFGIDMQPFKFLIQGDASLYIKPNSLPAIMPAHIIYPAIDYKPAGFSKVWLQDILRKQLAFSGLIISDCLSMQAVQDFTKKQQNLAITNAMNQYNVTHTQAVNLILTIQALEAGCDLIIFNNLHDENLENLLNNIK